VSFGDPKYEDQHRLVVISCPDEKKAAWMIMQEAATLSVYCECILVFFASFTVHSMQNDLLHVEGDINLAISLGLYQK